MSDTDVQSPSHPPPTNPQNTISPSSLLNFSGTPRSALPFQHIKLLGHGSSAVIELVRDRTTQQTFALKTFPRHNGAQFASAKRALENEVAIMTRLAPHIHIVQVLGTFASSSDLGIMLSPAASDGDLARYITDAVACGVPTRSQRGVLQRAFGCLVRGLSHIHAHTIRHKDIKPQNILVHHGRVMYADFGISFDAEGEDTMTVGPPGAYTPRYCAPEVNDWGDRNRKSDVYSLGCVFVEMLDVLDPGIGLRSKDSLPYHRKIEEIRRRLCEGANGKRDVGVNRGLLGICHDMLDPDQVARIDTADVLQRVVAIAGVELKRENSYFCRDCAKEHLPSSLSTPEDLTEDFTAISLGATSSTEEIVAPPSPTLEHKTSTSPPKKEKTKKKKRSPIKSKSTRYYCKTCNSLGHTTTDCPNICPNCSTLYPGHNPRSCPSLQKCWTCKTRGHYARNCPNVCSACERVGHATAHCPDRCWTCGGLGHTARYCGDACLVCGQFGHATKKCKGRCHRCGGLGHWSRGCREVCFKCGRFGHWAAECRSKGMQPHHQREWQPIIELVPQGPFQVNSRRRQRE
ncbi:unnamed protein product [Periconia digitata]|uniref:Kinase-like protein n=1 Tax=Periconia digitata TaxID=1303443 RepID=A0A9W4XHB5_9PLEO|nr:unnamed protein product [Periconia digitata]